MKLNKKRELVGDNDYWKSLEKFRSMLVEYYNGQVNIIARIKILRMVRVRIPIIIDASQNTPLITWDNNHHQF